jgi:hypothetical protein
MTAPKATPKTNAMPYTGNKDANPKGKATPGAKKLLEILHNKWGFKNLGIYAYRQMRGSTFISSSRHRTRFRRWLQTIPTRTRHRDM